jgi:transposase
MDLTDDQWAVLAPLLPAPRVRRDRRGRPWRDPRDVLNGILWVLRIGAPWKDLPARYPSYQTCHRRFQHWQRSGVYDAVLQRLAEDLRDWGQLDLTVVGLRIHAANARFRLCDDGPIVGLLEDDQ